MKWQILIATIVDRKTQFQFLKSELEYQIHLYGLEKEVEVLFDQDNREKAIGKKRQDLLDRCAAEYMNYMDDDDLPYGNYIIDIYEALLSGPDCVGLLIDMTTNGIRKQTCCHSLRYPIWADKRDGYDYVRNVTHFNPVKRELAAQVGFSDLRFGEDKEYSDKITKLCKNEVFINRPVFHYRYSNQVPHNKKYGIA